MARKILITGAAGQLGRMYVGHLADNPSNIIFAVDKLTEVPSDWGHNVSYYPVDLTNTAEVDDLISKIGVVDVLLNNAGIGVFTDLLERTEEEFDAVFSVNVKSTFFLTQRVLRLMLERHRGLIINTGSVYGSVSSDYRIYGDSGRNNSEIYSMTKAAIIAFTRHLAASYGHLGVRSNCLSPGGVQRQQTDDFISAYSDKTPLTRLCKDLELLPAIDFLLDERNTYLNGHNLIVDGGMSIW